MGDPASSVVRHDAQTGYVIELESGLQSGRLPVSESAGLYLVKRNDRPARLVQLTYLGFCCRRLNWRRRRDGPRRDDRFKHLRAQIDLRLPGQI